MMLGALGLSAASAGHRRMAGGGNPLSFGNVTVAGSYSGQNAPMSRRMAMLGDSRISAISGGPFASQVVYACGEWIWINPNAFDYGLGGTTINHARTTQAPAAVADGCRVFVVLTGVNGAGGTDTLATRQSELLGLLAVLDGAGNTIFLCNDMPEGAAPQKDLHYQYHQWLDGLTAGAAGLSNAALAIVNTWGAVSTGTGQSVQLAAQWQNDLLHPKNTGQERMAKAVWAAMGAHFSGPHVNFGSPSQRLSDGTTTVNVNRGVLPSGWTDAAAAGGITYSVAGTGANTVVTFDNTGNGANATLACRITPGAAVTDGVLVIDYELDVDPAPDLSTRNSFLKLSIRNFDYGSGANQAVVNFWQGDISSTQQDTEMGGRRRMALRLGASAASRRIDLLWQIKAGARVRVHAIDLYER